MESDQRRARRQAGHPFAADERNFCFAEFATTRRHNRGNPALREIDCRDLFVGGLQALAELHRHEFKVRLQQCKVRIRQRGEDAIALHIRCLRFDHGPSPSEGTRARIGNQSSAPKLESMARASACRRRRIALRTVQNRRRAVDIHTTRSKTPARWKTLRGCLPRDPLCVAAASGVSVLPTRRCLLQHPIYVLNGGRDGVLPRRALAKARIFDRIIPATADAVHGKPNIAMRARVLISLLHRRKH